MRNDHGGNLLWVLTLTLYDNLGASSRVRFYQFIPLFEREGHVFLVNTLANERETARTYSRNRSVWSFFRSVIARVKFVRQNRHANLLWLEKELVPWLPWSIERFLYPRNIPIVVDFDDAVHHRYDHHSNTLVRFLFRDKIPSIMRKASTVVVGNEYLYDYARLCGAKNVTIVPSVIDTRKIQPHNAEQKNDRLAIGWIGSPITAEIYLRPKLNLFYEILSKQNEWVLRLIGADLDSNEFTENLKWDLDTENQLLSKIDIGIMPLDDSPWSRGKCGYKLLQYMAAGIPVVASPVGVNIKLIENGKNGFLASTDQEWERSLSSLMFDRELRVKLGKKGRHMVESDFAISSWSEPLLRILTRASLEKDR